jgi:organic hydroperoxide reductase OsmC/OhrA
LDDALRARVVSFGRPFDLPGLCLEHVSVVVVRPLVLPVIIEARRLWRASRSVGRSGPVGALVVGEELLPEALASCVVTTISMFARRKGWVLDEIGADVVFDRETRPAQCTIDVRLPEGLSDEQTRRLEQVAKACPVQRTLEHGTAFDHRVAVAAPL